MNILIAIALILSMNINNAIAKEIIEFEVTMYTSGYESTGKNPNHPAYNITSSGTQARHGVIAAGRMYPFGTKIYLEGLGTFVVEDRGGAIKNDSIDIWTDDLNYAYKFGRRKMKGWIVK